MSGKVNESWSLGWVHRGFEHDWERIKDLQDDIKQTIQVWDWYLRNDLVWLKYLLGKVKLTNL